MQALATLAHAMAAWNLTSVELVVTTGCSPLFCAMAEQQESLMKQQQQIDVSQHTRKKAGQIFRSIKIEHKNSRRALFEPPLNQMSEPLNHPEPPLSAAQ